jgi:hypothetical protein
MKTDPEHERKRTEFNAACEKFLYATGYRFRRWYISDRMMGSIQRYIHERIKPGRFLTAVICNDLSDAVGQADDENMANLPAYAAYFYNELPSDSWGSMSKMNEWLAKGEKNKNA